MMVEALELWWSRAQQSGADPNGPARVVRTFPAVATAIM